MNTSIQVLEEDIKDLKNANIENWKEVKKAMVWYEEGKRQLEALEKQLAELKSKQ